MAKGSAGRIVCATALALISAAAVLPAPAQGIYGGTSVSQTVSASLSKSNGFLSFDGQESSGFYGSSSPDAAPYQGDDDGCFLLRINSTMRFGCGNFNVNITQPLTTATVTGSAGGCSVNISISVAPTVATPPAPYLRADQSLSLDGGGASAGSDFVREGGTASGSWSCSGLGTISGGTGSGSIGIGAGGYAGYYL